MKTNCKSWDVTDRAGYVEISLLGERGAQIEITNIEYDEAQKLSYAILQAAQNAERWQKGSGQNES